MNSEAVGPDLSAGVRHDAADRMVHAHLLTTALSGADTGDAIGYEAAHPALQTPEWTETVQAVARHLR